MNKSLFLARRLFCEMFSQTVSLLNIPNNKNNILCLFRKKESEQKGTVLISHLSGSEFSHNSWTFHPSRSPAAAFKSFSNAHENLVFMHKACSIVKKLPLIIKSEIGLDSLQKQKKFPSKKKTIKHHRTWQCRVEAEAKRDKKKQKRRSLKPPEN